MSRVRRQDPIKCCYLGSYQLLNKYRVNRVQGDRYAACAEPSMEPTPRLAGHRPLLAKAATVPHPGAATLFVFPVGSGSWHRRDLSMQMAYLILHLGA
jgi:hypothetical protein